MTQVVFRFWSLTEEERDQILANPALTLENLRACQPLANRLAADTGIYTVLSEQEEQNLQQYHLIQQAYDGEELAGRFDELRRQAGLLLSDAGLLDGRVETLFQQREPVLYQAQMFSTLHQWFLNKKAMASQTERSYSQEYLARRAESLALFLEEQVMATPGQIRYWCSGTEEEVQAVLNYMVGQGLAETCGIETEMQAYTGQTLYRLKPNRSPEAE